MPPRRTTLPPFDTLKGVLFDIDGTMTDSDTLHRAACGTVSPPSLRAF